MNENVFSRDEVHLLQSVLIFMTEKSDWDVVNGTHLIRSRVLMNNGENVPERLNVIYNKLFSF